MDLSHDDSPEAELPSCSGCRKRKLKCSRQRPACSNCERLGAPCVYENRRTKPGLKGGAVESLNQRLEKVEKALFGSALEEGTRDSEGTNCHPSADRTSSSSSAPLEAILSTLAGELQKLNKNIEPTRKRQYEYDPYRKVNALFKRQRRDIAQEQHQSSNGDITHQRTRQASVCRTDIVQDHLDKLLEAHFDNIQPWIPMVIMRGFHERIQRDTEQQMTIVLEAMMIASLRYVEINDKPLDDTFISSETSRLRTSVMMGAMEGLRTENLQALIMIAFTEIGNGNLEKAWPIIGTLTRTVEYMGLSVESEVHERKRGLLSDSSSLPEPRDWLEEEERRRIFWNIFILDRISSIIKGWNPGINSGDVRRRLPICGGSWFHNEPAVTPYFGNWDQPAAHDSHGTSPCYSVGSNAGGAERPASTYSIRTGDRATGDISKIGALAYYIQSIDSLCQISKTFLQPTVDFTNRQGVSLWLTKFKELDLRLVHWKMYLPQQWKDSGVSRKIMPGVMDPSMTLANATHNTSVILLHERIAYPDSELLGLNIPSQFSAQNCLNAAIETANITTKYLGGSPSARPVPPQMGICAFVSARTLLVHSQYYNTPLSKEFQNLMDNLTDMSNRWASHEQADQTKKTPNFFDQLFSSLKSQSNQSQEAATGHTIRSQGSALQVEGSVFSSRPGTSRPFQDSHAPAMPDVPQTVENLTRGMHNPVQLSNHQWNVDTQSPHTVSKDDLFTISQTLLNDDFLELDRIVSFEDMMAVGNMTQYYGPNS
ncbi:hypothetical protein FOXB_01373 [Fusarium oxysporum f. sp. conglutinans Fo5176]|uniref:Zn(2)-C6 fungal-type domain-containing protein n=2 Tax=Fusarium oxysporum f. sp. conglutinans TaxID=100902 RepID=F9F4P8_FUSOF|nr:hypothetical protein FOXB_01373 [Fusarium oxysporum f. sp. conglutinans Fo5176]KAG6978543.1 putative transcriptional regulatory protein [Fusarium oxysporum f. sp. conglutinans]KAI8395046.1 hypothetical protein FOFC_21538 [Fusarium oxysporum]KAI8410827.1 hypothetical protein FOFC_10686 [Fusarium oxysporum]